MDLYEKLHAVRWCRDVSELPSDRSVEVGFSGAGGAPPADLHFAKQVHGTSILRAEATLRAASKRRPEADAVMTEVPGTTVGVQTADCLPILLWAPCFAVAVHAGWRGLAKGMVKEVAASFKEHGQKWSETCVVIGPAISAAAFQIGWEVVTAFRQGPDPLAEGEEAFCLLKGVGDRWHLDLQAAAVIQLLKKGLSPERIAVVRTCTFSAAGEWHSYRRQGEKAGRNWAWMTLK